eukprot:TRINITY_DN2591_c0_g1_i3.p1 TRINITY_DN2591_c0_g1~~TRINITY_DN2591_c0_g1_i3.p1  ORF type:complete len:261 (-),score=32.59 TRINITY_DN2591_c0_g1_i3:14-796(-)
MWRLIFSFGFLIPIQGHLMIVDREDLYFVDINEETVVKIPDTLVHFTEMTDLGWIQAFGKTYIFERDRYWIASYNNGLDCQEILYPDNSEMDFTRSPKPIAVDNGRIVLLASSSEIFDTICIIHAKSKEPPHVHRCSGFLPTDPDGVTLVCSANLIGFFVGRSNIALGTFYMLQLDSCHWTSYVCAPQFCCLSHSVQMNGDVVTMVEVPRWDAPTLRVRISIGDVQNKQAEGHSPIEISSRPIGVFRFPAWFTDPSFSKQ